jgi:integrase
MALYRRKNSPYWWYSFAIDGRHVQGNTHVTDRRLAVEVYHKIRNDYVSGKFLNQPAKILVSDYLTHYLVTYSQGKKRSYRDDTIKARTLTAFFTTERLGDITPERLEQYRSHRLCYVSPSRVNRELALLRHVFTKAIDEGKAHVNPVKKIKFFNERERWRDRYLSFEEKKTLLKASPSWLHDVLIVALKTGLRKGELLELKWEDIDFDRLQLAVRHSKSQKPRYVPLHDDVVTVLTRMEKQGEYVFVGEGGKRRTVVDLRRDFEAARKASKITGFWWHDTRHTFASELVQKGESLYTIAKILGHSTQYITERYAHLSPNQRRMAIQKLDSDLQTPATLLLHSPGEAPKKTTPLEVEHSERR